MLATTEVMIRKSPNVCGGQACIRKTRITVWILVGYRHLGVLDSRLLEFYPTLNQDDLNAAWEYYEQHRPEIDEVIRQNDQDD